MNTKVPKLELISLKAGDKKGLLLPTDYRISVFLLKREKKIILTEISSNANIPQQLQ